MKCDISETKARELIWNVTFSEPKSADVKMQKIEISKVSNDIRNSIEFKSLFKNLLRDKPEYCNIQKQFYLKKLSVNKVEVLIKDFEMPSSAYAEAWTKPCKKSI